MIPFLPPYWIDFVAFFQLEIFFLKWCLPSCWNELIAFFQLEACSSASISFVSFYSIEFIVFFPHSFLLFCWIEIVFLSARNLFVPAFPFFLPIELHSLLSFSLKNFVWNHFRFSILLSWVHCFLSAKSLQLACSLFSFIIHSFFLFYWIEIITFLQLEACSFLHFMSFLPSELTSLLSCRLENFPLTSFPFFHPATFWLRESNEVCSTGWKKAKCSRKSTLLAERTQWC